MMFMILLIESQASFRVLWLRRWFRVLFWVSAVTSLGAVMKEMAP